MALNFISGSTYLMFKGGSLITTVAFSKILFGMTIQKRHVAGCRLAIIGLIIVGGSGFLNSSSSSTELVISIIYSLLKSWDMS
jgi:hypothetical protein